MLFQISGTNVFIIGAVHRQPDGVAVPARYFTAIAEADECYFEHKSTGEHLAVAGVCPGKTWLGTYAPFGLCVRTFALYARLRVPIRDFPLNRKPWWVSIQLHGTISNIVGHKGANSVDGQLWTFVEKNGKCPLVLDSPNVWELFESVPMKEQISELDYIVSDLNRCIVNAKTTYENWAKGDLGALAIRLEDWLKDQPVTATKVILDRNKAWFPTILNAVQNKRRAVFSVGAMHLVGPSGLLEMLEAEPYCHDIICLRHRVV